jgi:hypothetical protein
MPVGRVKVACVSGRLGPNLLPAEPVYGNSGDGVQSHDQADEGEFLESNIRPGDATLTDLKDGRGQVVCGKDLADPLRDPGKKVDDRWGEDQDASGCDLYRRLKASEIPDKESH